MKLIARITPLFLLWFATAAIPATIQAPAFGNVFAIPEPAGLVAMKNPDARYFTFNQELQKKSNNRLIAMMLTPADAKTADGGGLPSPDVWAVTFVSSTLANTKISAREFKNGRDEIVGGIEKAMGSKFVDGISANTNEALAGLLKEKGAPAGSVTLKMGSMMPLGLYAREDDHVTYGVVTRIQINVQGKVEEIPMVMMITIVSTKSTLVNLACYRHMKSRADIDSAKAMMASWVKEFIQANR